MLFWASRICSSQTWIISADNISCPYFLVVQLFLPYPNEVGFCNTLARILLMPSIFYKVLFWFVKMIMSKILKKFWVVFKVDPDLPFSPGGLYSRRSSVCNRCTNRRELLLLHQQSPCKTGCCTAGTACWVCCIHRKQLDACLRFDLKWLRKALPLAQSIHRLLYWLLHFFPLWIATSSFSYQLSMTCLRYLLVNSTAGLARTLLR